MIRPAFMLSHLPFAELLDDIQLLLNHDAELLEKQTQQLQQLEQEGCKPESYLERFRERLNHAQTRLEFFNSLLGRLQTLDFRYLVKAIEAAKGEAKTDGMPEMYGFTILFEDQLEPQILLH